MTLLKDRTQFKWNVNIQGSKYIYPNYPIPNEM